MATLRDLIESVENHATNLGRLYERRTNVLQKIVNDPAYDDSLHIELEKLEVSIANERRVIANRKNQIISDLALRKDI